MKLKAIVTLAIAFLLTVPALSVQQQLVAESGKHDWIGFAFREGDVTRIIVGLRNDEPVPVLRFDEMAAKHNGRIVNTVSIKGLPIALAVELPISLVNDFSREALASGLVSYVEPDWEYRIQFTPDDPLWDLQWGPRKIEADLAWDTILGSKPFPLVAVVDTGIDWEHPDLAGNYVPLGYDWVNMDDDPMDDHGHGTHCAGILAAVINNGIGIAGLAQVRVMAEKGLDAEGKGYAHWLANCIIHAVERGANIISMSWGGWYYSKLIHSAIKYAYDNGVLLVAAAGNAHASWKLYPAAYDEVIAVSATDHEDHPAGFTNFGEWIEIAAPGVGIISTWLGGVYRNASGTSMSAPHVAGVAALIWGRFPDKPRDWVRAQLRYTADDLGAEGFDIKYGYGRLNARKAVECAPPARDLAIYSWGTPPCVELGYYGIVNATVINFGATDEENVNVQLMADGAVVDTAVIPSLPAGRSATVSLYWSPAVGKKYNVTLFIVPVQEEADLKNNVVWKYIHAGKPFKAVVLDSEGNYAGFTTPNWDRLNAEWDLYGTTMVYVDYLTLRKEDITYEDIAATGAKVLIISSSWSKALGWEFTDSEIEAIRQYVEEGHGIIITECSFYKDAPNNRKLAELVGLKPIILDYDKADKLALLELKHPIFRGIPNPYRFPKIITGLPMDEKWDEGELAGGRYIALDKGRRSAVVVYKRSRTYISPLLECIDPYKHKHHLRLLYNAITWSPHELTALIKAPPYVSLDTLVTVNATALNAGVVDEADVTLQLLMNGTVVDSKVVPHLKAGASYTLEYAWTPTVEGVYNFTAYVKPVKGETYFEDNSATVIVKVIRIRDVAVSEIVSPRAVYASKNASVSVVVSNLGEFAETFDVVLYYDLTVIGVETVTDLKPGASVRLTFTWATAGMTPCLNVTLWAEAKPVPGEVDLVNNVLVYGPVKVKMLGDVDGDGDVDIYDVVMCTGIYGLREGDPRWNPEADLAEPWGIINIYDVIVITARYGSKC